MFQFYIALLLILSFTFSNSINTTASSSRSIYNLIENRRITAFNNKTDRLYNDNKNTNISRRRILSERFTVIAIISGISIGFMTSIVIIYIALQYARNKRIQLSESIEQRRPLNASRKTIHSSTTNYDGRNVSRKTKTLSTPPTATTFV
jgi:hypothetical protein